VATAGTVAAADPERATQKFQEGVHYRDAGDYARAAASFEESEGLTASPGTLLNLGNCYERLGRLRDAEGAYQRALEDSEKELDRTRREGWSEFAKQRIAEVSGRVPSLMVRASTEGAQVFLNDHPIQQGRAVRLDPGRYRLEARGEGRRSFVRDIELGERQQLEVMLPELAEEAPIPPPPAAPSRAPLEQEASTESARFGVAPWILWGSGAAFMGSAVVTGVMAKSKENHLKESCPDVDPDTQKHVCDPSLASTKHAAQTLATTTNVLWGVGIVSAAVGTVLWFLDASRSTSAEAGQSAFGADCSRSGCSVSLQGSF
jgi:hypothetical protein